MYPHCVLQVLLWHIWVQRKMAHYCITMSLWKMGDSSKGRSNHKWAMNQGFRKTWTESLIDISGGKIQNLCPRILEKAGNTSLQEGVPHYKPGCRKSGITFNLEREESKQEGISPDYHAVIFEGWGKLAALCIMADISSLISVYILFLFTNCLLQCHFSSLK